MEFDQIRVKILGKDPFPSLDEVYAFAQQEESRRGSMLPHVNQERSAMVLAPTKRERLDIQDRAKDQGSTDKSQFQCDYCGK